MIVFEMLKGLLFLAIASILLLVSFPMIAIAMGLGVSGDNKRMDWWMEHSPLVIFLDWKL